MKTIIQKGIAGLGNRFQVLGYSFDLAKKHKADLLVDWRDSSWGDDFENYFTPKSNAIHDFKEQEFGKVIPKVWDGKINEQCAKVAWGNKIPSVGKKEIESDCDTLVICQYLAEYSNDIFGALVLSDRIFGEYRKIRNRIGNYVCWHIRDTDKSGGNSDGIMISIDRHKTSHKKVVITDNLNVKEMAGKLGIYCPSIIPRVPQKGGIHHCNASTLANNGLTKRQINDSALVDVMIGANAIAFNGTCSNSSYSQLIDRVRANIKELKK